MNRGLYNVWSAIRTTYIAWRDDQAQRLSAALAFYALFALSPLLVILVGFAGRIFGREAARASVVSHIGALIGQGAAAQIGEMIRATGAHHTSLLVSMVGIVTLVLGAMGIFGELKGALDTIWKVAPAPRSGLWNYVRGNLLSLAMLSGAAVLLLLSLLFTAAVSLVAHWAEALVPGSTLFALRMADLLLSFTVTTLFFAMIYRILPEARISWGDVWIGAAATAVLFSLGKVVIGQYLIRSHLGSAFGAAGSLGVILAWIYYSASVCLFGAEFTEVYSRSWGSRAPPREQRISPKREAARSK